MGVDGVRLDGGGGTLKATGAMLAQTGLASSVLRAGEIAVFLLPREDA